MFIIIILLLFITILVASFILFFQKFHNFEVKKYSELEEIFPNTKIRNILIIFPHPDDETINTGVILSEIASNPKYNIKSITLTKGEKGNELLNVGESEMGKIRTQELQKALNFLGIKNFEVWDFPDGNVMDFKNKLKVDLEKSIKEFETDLIITFDKDGIYGHADHVATSEVVHEIVSIDPQIKVLYNTINSKQKKYYDLPFHMCCKDRLDLSKPEVRIGSFRSIFARYKAAQVYKSQNLGRNLPLWLLCFLKSYEYYRVNY